MVTVSSGGMYTARLTATTCSSTTATFDGPRFYAHTKRAEVVLNELWAQREGEQGVVFAAMHPGWADTPGLQRSLPRFHRLTRPLLRDARQGADTIVWLATAPAARRPRRAVLARPAPAAHPPAAGHARVRTGPPGSGRPAAN